MNRALTTGFYSDDFESRRHDSNCSMRCPHWNFFSLSFFLEFFFFFHEIKKEKMIKVDNSRVGLEERQKGDENTLSF